MSHCSSLSISLIEKLKCMALTSDIHSKHAAAILKNGVGVAFGINLIRGSCNYHAEYDAVRRYLYDHGINFSIDNKSSSLRGSP